MVTPIWRRLNFAGFICSRTPTPGLPDPVLFFRSVSESISSIVCDGGVSTSPCGIGTMLNNSFVNVGINLSVAFSRFTSDLPSLFHPFPSCVFSFSKISRSFVLDQLEHLKVKKATGLDKFRAKLLNDSAKIVVLSLTRLLNMS